MRAYVFDEALGDQREEHNSGVPIDMDYLRNLGILYYHCPSISSVDQIASERSYKNRDEITISPEAMGSIYEVKLQTFFQEHLHEDEEIRYITEGQGFFDVRDAEDRWIRIKVEPFDLLILPAGIYHRFTIDVHNYIKAMRLFKDEPKWTPLPREPTKNIT